MLKDEIDESRVPEPLQHLDPSYRSDFVEYRLLGRLPPFEPPREVPIFPISVLKNSK